MHKYKKKTMTLTKTVKEREHEIDSLHKIILKNSIDATSNHQTILQESQKLAGIGVISPCFGTSVNADLMMKKRSKSKGIRAHMNSDKGELQMRDLFMSEALSINSHQRLNSSYHEKRESSKDHSKSKRRGEQRQEIAEKENSY